MTYIKQGTNLYLDNEPFSEKTAGGSAKNFWLYGLRYKLTIKVTGDVSDVFLYSSDILFSETNRFSFTNEGNGVWTYEETAGNVATDLSIATKNGANWVDGIEFYFRIKIVGKNLACVIDKRFWVRNPVDFICFDAENLNYLTPYPVLIAGLLVAINIGPSALNAVGLKKYGGVATVEIFDNPSALSSGSHVVTVSETVVRSLPNTITLIDRSELSGDGIPEFIPNPGAADYSRFYHYLTFRFRSKVASEYYVDYPVVLCAIAGCKGGSYGYDSSGSGLPAPAIPNLTIIPPENPPEGPPPICSSITELKTDNPLNVYSIDTAIKVYNSVSGGNLLASGVAVITGTHTLTISRTALGGDTDQPIEGFYEIVETGPDRTSVNRYETIVYGCVSEPVTIDTVDYGSGTGLLTTTLTSRGFLPGGEYIIELYTNKHDITPSETFTGTYSDVHILTFPVDSGKTGYWAVIENGVQISAKIEETVLAPVAIEELSSVVGTGQLATTAGSRNLLVDGIYGINLYTNEGDPVPSETFVGTYVDIYTVSFPIDNQNKDGWWKLIENGLYISNTLYDSLLPDESMSPTIMATDVCSCSPVRTLDLMTTCDLPAWLPWWNEFYYGWRKDIGWAIIYVAYSCGSWKFFTTCMGHRAYTKVIDKCNFNEPNGEYYNANPPSGWEDTVIVSDGWVTCTNP